MKTPTYRRWLKEQLDFLLEWEAVGCRYQSVDDDWIIEEARRLALKLQLPEIAKLIKPCKTVSAACETLSTCLAELTKSDWIELNEAARIIGCSVSGLRKLVGRGAIRFAQSGKHCRIRFKREWFSDLAEPSQPQKPTRKPKAKARIYIEPQFGFDPALLNL